MQKSLEGKANVVTLGYTASSILYQLHDKYQLPKCDDGGQVSRRIIQTVASTMLTMHSII